MALNTRELRLYKQLRSDGTPARYAYGTVTNVRRVRAFVAEFVADGPDYGTFTVPMADGWLYTVRFERDEDAGRPEDNGDDCYSVEDVAAWEADRWHYWGVVVDARGPAGTEGSTSLWGIDAGDYFDSSGLSEEEQLWDAVIGNGMLDEAKYEAVRVAANARAQALADRVAGYALAEVASW